MLKNKEHFKSAFKRKLSTMFGKPLEDATTSDAYAALASLIRDDITEAWIETNARYLRESERQVYYFSLEFLLGRFLESNLLSLGARESCEEGLRELGIELDTLLDAEPDAGLGNGGLGRLAACFLDSLASMGYAGNGNGIRYKYGLFSQRIVDGYQVELPDNWLREANMWEFRKADKSVEVLLGGRCYPVPREDHGLKFVYEDALRIRAVPYDIPIAGYQTHTVNTLRLWSAEVAEDERDFNFASFSRGDYINAVSDRYAVEAISEVLYPDDSNFKNRELRLKQQYFFVSAGLQSILRHYRRRLGRDIAMLDKYICVQINDTHPSLAVPELMRLLLDDCGMEWSEAWRITTNTIAYTNHTIMPEALEKWPVETVRYLLPRIFMIIEEINRRFCEEVRKKYPSDNWRVDRMSIIHGGEVRMAHLAIIGSFSVNGVAAVHSELLKQTILHDFYEFYPKKFNNKTNGITHRRWLMKANPELSDLLCETIGKDWVRHPEKLADFEAHKDDAGVLKAMEDIKRRNKVLLADIVKQKNDGLIIDPDSIFDVQVKRIHAYKRQLLNILHVLHLYFRLVCGEDIGTPRTFIMAGKAAPSYYYAKSIIKLANETSRLLASSSACKGKLAFVFLENYGITLAERLFPAAEVSEQISTASKEASGTSNMKFMMNGAVTIGTADGANIEIEEQVGAENYIGFGLSVAEVLSYYTKGNYNANQVYNSDPRLKRVLDYIRGGLSGNVPGDEFASIARSLLDYNDEFFVLRDFDGYVKAHEKLEGLYRDPKTWNRMSLVNIAKSGIFSSDRTIRQYADEIWKIKPNKTH